jgi:hypothetical protein
MECSSSGVMDFHYAPHNITAALQRSIIPKFFYGTKS